MREKEKERKLKREREREREIQREKRKVTRSLEYMQKKGKKAYVPSALISAKHDNRL
jgi:hypothetical protein